MIYDLHNPSPSLRIFFDAAKTQQFLHPRKDLTGIELTEQEAGRLRAAGMKVVGYDAVESGVERPASTRTGKPAIYIDGMWGIGDNLHQRAPIRELMKDNEVWLSTCHWQLYHDLVANGLHLVFKSTRLRAQSKTIERERDLFTKPPIEPGNTRRIKLWYKKPQIDQYGSILETMMAECGVPGKGDFSLPIPDEWRARAEALKVSWKTDKPIMLYRPIVRRREWNGESRNPDPVSYAKLYEAARAGYFTVSIADLEPKEEWIVGDEQPADIKLHQGELDFETMAALFSIADIGFFNAGFAPVLAQAVGLKSIVVYGGRESFRTTQAAGVHLAPTLGIDPINPCDCHTERHGCDKRIALPPALDKVREFADKYRFPAKASQAPVKGTVVLRETSFGEEKPPRGNLLIFATTYVDSEARQALTEQWLELTHALNPDCPLLLVDSKSPLPLVGEVWKKQHPDIVYRVFDFGNNIGHLSRAGGRDGWGRAFCKGLEIAVEEGFTYVAHIEGDSLLRLPVDGLIDQMIQAQRECCTTAVAGMKRDMPGWVETGLMIFKTAYVKESNFIQKYSWPIRRVSPTPEVVISNIIKSDVFMLPIKAVRGDKQQITHENVLSLNLDWITHCHNDVWATDRFFDDALKVAGLGCRESYAESNVTEVIDGSSASSLPAGKPDDPPSAAVSDMGLGYHGLLLNLGCGGNKLSGWLNHDADVDVTQPLPWADNSAYYIFIEHCLEHVSYHQAIGFFEEAFRVLAPGGVLRVVVPSIEQIANTADQAYFAFAAKWGGEATLKGALKAILFSHGHQQAWTASLMRHSLLYAGFEAVEQCQVGISRHSALRGVEGHGKVIGNRFNAIESMCFEATKQPHQMTRSIAPNGASSRVALVVGGSEKVKEELAEAEALCAAAGCDVTRFVINDMIPQASGPCIAVSLHPTKLSDWLKRRGENGHPAPSQVWAHRGGPNVTHHVEDWAGSSGLFAVKIARQLGFERIILCGVPMNPSAKHVVRDQPWPAALTFRRGWDRHKDEIKPFVRSMSGWTAEQFGRAAAAFIT